MGLFNIVCTVENVFFCLLFCSFLNSTIKLFVFLLCARVSPFSRRKLTCSLVNGRRRVGPRLRGVHPWLRLRGVHPWLHLRGVHPWLRRRRRIVHRWARVGRRRVQGHISLLHSSKTAKDNQGAGAVSENVDTHISRVQKRQSAVTQKVPLWFSFTACDAQRVPASL